MSLGASNRLIFCEGCTIRTQSFPRCLVSLFMGTKFLVHEFLEDSVRYWLGCLSLILYLLSIIYLSILSTYQFSMCLCMYILSIDLCLFAYMYLLSHITYLLPIIYLSIVCLPKYLSTIHLYRTHKDLSAIYYLSIIYLPYVCLSI